VVSVSTGTVWPMSELQADEPTVAFVREQAQRSGVSESEWLARHFRDVALAEAVDALAGWYAERPGLLEHEVREAEAAAAEADAA